MINEVKNVMDDAQVAAFSQVLVLCRERIEHFDRLAKLVLEVSDDTFRDPPRSDKEIRSAAYRDMSSAIHDIYIAVFNLRDEVFESNA